MSQVSPDKIVDMSSLRRPERPGERIERDLRARLDAGEWAPGEQLPTLGELAVHYSASRETVARVVRRLAAEGLLVVVDRWGTFRALSFRYLPLGMEPAPCRVLSHIGVSAETVKTGVTGMECRIHDIKKLDAEADKLESDANDLRWYVAQLIAAELDEGTSQRKLAKEMGKSQGHVSKCATLWRRYGADSVENHQGEWPENLPLWTDAYREVSGKPAPVFRPEPEAEEPAPAGSGVPARPLALGPGVVQGEVVYDDDDDDAEEPWTEEQEAEFQATVERMREERKRVRLELTGDEDAWLTKPVLRRAARERLIDARWSNREGWWLVHGPMVPLYAGCSDEGLAQFMTDPDVAEFMALAEKIRSRYVSDAHVQKWTALARGEK